MGNAKNKKMSAVGFEPTLLSEPAPKAGALTTRPNTHHEDAAYGYIFLIANMPYIWQNL
jgi:hypothetical protein